MPNLTIGLGVALVLVGLVGYFGTGTQSRTALIPAAFGAVFLLLGLLALSEKIRKHAMHAAAALGLLTILGTARGLAKLPALLTGGEVDRPGAVVSQSVTAVLCVIFVALCVRSFVNARRARTAE